MTETKQMKEVVMVPINDGNDPWWDDVVFIVLNVLCWGAFALTIWSNSPR